MSIASAMRLTMVGAGLADRMPAVFDKAIALLESLLPAFDAARPERYELQHTLGAGGQAEVLLATLRGAEGFRRPVAIKRVPPLRATERGADVRLIEEARRSSVLSHPNVVSVIDFDRDRAGQLLLVMEYIDGVDLAKLVATGPVPHPVVIFIVSELLAGLGYIHQLPGEGLVHGLVHRDVAPDNVLLSREGAVKLADFGIARPLIEGMTPASGRPVGKAGYMSPEQADGDTLDGRSDLYAVGVILWELLTFRRLRAGAAGDRVEDLVSEDIPRPSELTQGVPADLEAVAMRLLAFDCAERYQTAELAARDLALCQAAPRDGRRELVRLLAERFPAPYALAAAESGPNGQEAGQGRAGTLERRSQRWRALAFGVLLALVLATIIALLLVGYLSGAR